MPAGAGAANSSAPDFVARGRLPDRRLRAPARQARGRALPGVERPDEDRAAAGPAGRADAAELHAGRADARRPAAAADRQRRLRRRALRHRPRLRPAHEPVRGRDGDDDRDGDPEPLRVQPRLPGPAGRRGLRRRRPGGVRPGRRRARPLARPGGDPADEAGRDPGGRDRQRQAVHGRDRLPRRAAGVHRPGPLDRGLDPGLLHRLDGADLRLELRRRRADGLAGVVPVEQLPVRQGDVRDLDHGSDRRSGVRRRRARRRSGRQRRRHHDLELDRGRPDRDLPGHGIERRLRLHRDDRERGAHGRTLPIYNAIDPSASAEQRTASTPSSVATRR